MTGSRNMSTIFGYGRGKAVLVLLALGLAATGVQAQTCPAGNPRVALDGRYVNNGDGTVTDTETGLRWSQCSQGQSGADCASGTVSSMSWSSALTAANASTLGGHEDWRLPNSIELQSLAETGCYSPSINTTMFPATASAFYWSSTTYAPNASYAWGVVFYDGSLNAYGKSNGGAVRLVRGGQGLDSFAAEDAPIFKDGFEDVNARPVPRHGDSTLVTRSPD